MYRNAEVKKLSMVTEHSIMSSTVPMEIENSGGERDNEKGKTQCDQCTTLKYVNVNVIAYIVVCCGVIISCMYIIGHGMQRYNRYRE